MNNGIVRLHEPKNIERIISIRTRRDAEVIASIRTPQLRRWLLRDFYFVTGRLYLLSHGVKTRAKSEKRIYDALKDVAFAGAMLTADAERFTGAIPEQFYPPEKYSLRLVSRDAALLYREIVRGDAALIRLLSTELDGIITFEERENMFAPFILALTALKHISMGHTPKTAADIAAELAIV